MTRGSPSTVATRFNASESPPEQAGTGQVVWTPASRVAVVSFVLVVLAALAWLADTGTSTAFTFLYSALALVPLAVERNPRPSLDPFDPYIGLAILLYLYSVATLQLVEESRATYYQELVPAGALNQYALVCLAGLLGLVLGNLAYRRHHPLLPPVGGEDSSVAPTRILFGGLLVLAILLFPFYLDRFDFLNVISYADAAFAVRLDRMADGSAGIKEVFLKEIPTTIVLCWVTVTIFNGRTPLWRRGVAAAVLLSFFATSFLSGLRGQLVCAALVPIMYFHYRVRRLRLWEILTAGIGVYVLVNALSVVRTTASLSEMVSLLGDEMYDGGFSFLKLSRSGELATSSNLLRMIIGLDSGETHFMFGGLLASQLGSVVPRAIWPGRPPLGNELFVQVFYPGVLESGGGYGFFLPQDGYWDFGTLGVIFYTAALTVVVLWIYDLLVVRRSGTLWPLLYALLYGQLVLSSVRQGLFAGLKLALMAALPLLGALLMARFFAAKRPAEP